MASSSLRLLPAKQFATLVSSGPIVTIVVGPEKVEFKLPRNLLVEGSKYFEKAFMGYFSESDTQTLKLESESLEAFEHFVQYLYTGSIEFNTVSSVGDGNKGQVWGVTSPSFPSHHPLSILLSQFINFCILSDMFTVECTESLVGSVWDRIKQHLEIVTSDHIRLAWGNLPSGHPTRRMLSKATYSAYFDGIEHNNNRFALEIDEVDGYAADLLREYAYMAKLFPRADNKKPLQYVGPNGEHLMYF